MAVIRQKMAETIKREKGCWRMRTKVANILKMEGFYRGDAEAQRASN
jgi:hypothetical protein